MSLPKKLVSLVFIIIFLLGSSLLPFTHVKAQEVSDVFNDQSVQRKIDQEKQAREAEKTKPGETPDLQIFSTRVNNNQLGDSFYNLSSMIACLDKDLCIPNTTATGVIGSWIADVYLNPPASGIAYVRNQLANAGFVAKPALAQGVGFAGLTPFLGLWTASRNIAYSILILVMVAIGFMVIFRMKIDPKTVISLQAALPKIVLTVIIITLSYPIVGFLIDIMYFSMALIISIMLNGMGNEWIAKIPDVQTNFLTGSSWTLFGQVWNAGVTWNSLANLKWVGGIIPGIGGIAGAGIFTGGFAAIIGGTATIATAWPLLLGALAPAGLIVLLLFLGILYIYIRILMILLNSYIQLVLSLILGPILLLGEAIPGRSAFSQWFMNILANLSVFPTTAAILVFAMFLTSLSTNNHLWMPPFTGFTPQEAFLSIMGLSVVFMAPNLITSVKKMFGAKPTLPISAGTAFMPLTGGVQTTMGAASQFYYMQQMLSMFGKKQPGTH
ncbi:hypothetical protein HY338_03490 [Candidatus Gottesmanbacteria bacterium]|nr:hypothetical protein [Candidatus Gottesmanbacteria bacterium]